MEATKPYFGSKSASGVFSDEDETEPPMEQDIGDILKNIAKVAMPITLGLRHFRGCGRNDLDRLVLSGRRQPLSNWI
jgi:hypothetical protein